MSTNPTLAAAASFPLHYQNAACHNPYFAPQSIYMGANEQTCPAHFSPLHEDLHHHSWTTLQSKPRRAEIYYSKALYDPASEIDPEHAFNDIGEILNSALTNACKRLQMPDHHQAEIKLALLPTEMLLEAAKARGYTSSMPLILRQPNGIILMNGDVLLEGNKSLVKQMLSKMELATMVNIMMTLNEANEMLWLPNTKAPNWSDEPPKELAGDFLFRTLENPKNPTPPVIENQQEAFKHFVQFFMPELKNTLIKNPEDFRFSDQNTLRTMTMYLLAPFTIVQAEHLLEFQLHTMGIKHDVFSELAEVQYVFDSPSYSPGFAGPRFKQGSGVIGFNFFNYQKVQSMQDPQIKRDLGNMKFPILMVMHELAHIIPSRVGEESITKLAILILEKHHKVLSWKAKHCLKHLTENTYIHMEMAPDVLIEKLTGIVRFEQPKLDYENYYEFANEVARKMPAKDFEKFLKNRMSKVFLGSDHSVWMNNPESKKKVLETLKIYQRACISSKKTQEFFERRLSLLERIMKPLQGLFDNNDNLWK